MRNPSIASDRCRICGCTNLKPCITFYDGVAGACGWFDVDRTLCTNVRCVAQIPLEELLAMAAANEAALQLVLQAAIRIDDEIF